MTKKQAGRPIAAPKSRTPKAESQADTDWSGEARRLLKVEMESRSWGYRDLAEHLAKIGVEMDAPTVNRRINRGNFSAAFLLMCLEAMGLRVDVLPYGSTTRRRAGSEKPIDVLESVVGIWGTKTR